MGWMSQSELQLPVGAQEDTAKATMIWPRHKIRGGNCHVVQTRTLRTGCQAEARWTLHSAASKWLRLAKISCGWRGLSEPRSLKAWAVRRPYIPLFQQRINTHPPLRSALFLYSHHAPRSLLTCLSFIPKGHGKGSRRAALLCSFAFGFCLGGTWRGGRGFGLFSPTPGREQRRKECPPPPAKGPTPPCVFPVVYFLFFFSCFAKWYCINPFRTRALLL